MPERGERSLPLPGARRAAARSVRPASAAARPAGAARLGRHPLLRLLDSTPRGLTEQQAEERLARYGENSVLPLPGPGRLRRTLTALADPFTALLAALTVVSTAVDSVGTAVILGLLVLTAVGLRLAGERRSASALRELRDLLPATATVLRRAVAAELPLARELPAEQLVPGDVVRLAGGDAVPADLRLLRAEGLTVDQSALTGESEPVPRHAPDLPPPAAAAPFEEPHLLFAGSTVRTGTATALVLATGAATRFGAAHRPSEQPAPEWARWPRPAADPSADAPSAPSAGAPSGRWRLRSAGRRAGSAAGPSAVQRGVRRAVRALILFMAAAVPATVLADGLLHGWSRSLLPFAVAAAVGLTPELLPVVVSSVLARGGRQLGRQGLLVRGPGTVGELGALDVLCLDKTGTLTSGEAAVVGGLDPYGRPASAPLRWAAVAAEAALAEAEDFDPLDEALLLAAETAGLPGGPAGLTVRQVLPFDPVQRTGGVLLGGAGRRLLVVKGAPEAVLARCAGPGADERERLAALVAEQARSGLRLLAVARAQGPARLGAPEPDGPLELVGFVALSDEPVESAAGAVAALAGAKVRVTVLTGDHPGSAARLCGQLGLPVAQVLLGGELAALTDRELAAAAAGGAVFARCDPEQKARVVRALRRADRTVGFLGDGVNDVPALRAADVGIATAGAVGAARAWADLQLGGQDLATAGRALAAGREAVARVAAYLRIALSCNLGNSVSMLVGGVLLPFLPMLPVQVLLQNLCFDAAQLSFAVGGRTIRPSGRPVRLPWGTLAAFAAVFGLLNSVSDLALFGAVRWSGADLGGAAAQGAFHTAWFTENLITQALALPVLYCLGDAGPRPRPPRPVQWAAAGLAVVGVLLPLGPLGRALGFAPLPVAAYGPLALVVLGYAVLLWAGRTLWRWFNPVG
ncbi:magnesium-translocating P-type ATPase [Streptomyces tateyamensis]|uniref:Magnesium-translocating P-type ATPase n=1 Tax=Streptomyces tateyamensis TaxID=565073 RepID=A0A2V4NWF3_9ACTN|nr:HAD-IC family P-type ATPase [Streptomyces tateyamensis]PYC73881.1 magnesium-translocating P-type ATPase [Streptomyces tateyamensis]